MKITNVEAIIVKQKEIELIGDGSQDTVVIKVYTDEGIVGVGEVDSSPYVVKSVIEAPASHMVCMGLKHAVIGEDPKKEAYELYAPFFCYAKNGESNPERATSVKKTIDNRF